MRYPNTCALIAIIAMIALTGCKHHNAINFVTNTEFGVKVGVNAEKIPEVKIGYARQEAARVPVYLMDGAIATRTPGDVNSLLNQADKSLQTAEGVGTGAGQIPHIITAKNMIEAAYKADAAAKSPSKSLILTQIKDAGTALPIAGGATTAEILKLRGLISAERERPVFHTEFQEAGKFIGNKNGNDAKDAYSVIGTFKGNATGGGGNQASANMGIAQYFATGIAAQLLAESGAPVVSSAPNATTSAQAVQNARAAGVADAAAAKKIADDVYKASAAGAANTEQMRLARLTTLFQDAKISPGETVATEATHYSQLSRALLETKLANYYAGDLPKMLTKLPLP